MKGKREMCRSTAPFPLLVADVEHTCRAQDVFTAMKVHSFHKHSELREPYMQQHFRNDAAVTQLEVLPPSLVSYSNFSTGKHGKIKTIQER